MTITEKARDDRKGMGKAGTACSLHFVENNKFMFFQT